VTLIGARTRRVEDERLITGEGRFAGDARLPGLCHLVLLRSVDPHALLRSVDVSLARAGTGVLAAWSAADLEGRTNMPLAGFGGPGLDDDLRPRQLLAVDEVFHVGDAIAAVVAETPEEAWDAIELVDVDAEPLPAVAGADNAVRPGAPLVHRDREGNTVGRFVFTFGDIDAAFQGAAHRVRSRMSTDRVVGAAMEPRSVTAVPQSDGGLEVRTSTQAVFSVRDAIADVLGLEPSTIRVVAEDVGGGFGAKGAAYPEEVLVALAALRLRRPVRWIGTRTEDGMTTNQSHGTVFDLELAADADGRLRGVRGRVLHDIGAYAGVGVGQAGNQITHMLSAYGLPSMGVEILPLYTNTAPTGFIRGGGREMGNLAMERLIDRMADEIGLERHELRRRNVLRPEQLPYEPGLRAGPVPVRFDFGDVPAMLETVIGYLGKERLGVEGSTARGAGVVCFAESTGFGQREPARMVIGADGWVSVSVGSTPQGQGHQTMVAQIVATRLGWPMDRVRVVAGDTAAISHGFNTAGSRSAVHVGNAAAGVSREARHRVLELAGDRLEADAADLELDGGVVQVRGAPTRRIAVSDVVPDDGLEVVTEFTPDQATTWVGGCQGLVVEVDLETGRTDVVRSILAHDSGLLINPTIAEGQIHGGLAHGIGYALFESAAYEPDATMRAPSFLDYSIVSAPEMAVRLDLEHVETPSTATPEGFRGIGESGTIPVPAAVCSAVEDALRRAGRPVRIEELPITPERLLGLMAQRP
jgi:carbon-monoxide dehydrogenase large subunit